MHTGLTSSWQLVLAAHVHMAWGMRLHRVVAEKAFNRRHKKTGQIGLIRHRAWSDKHAERHHLTHDQPLLYPFLSSPLHSFLLPSPLHITSALGTVSLTASNTQDPQFCILISHKFAVCLQLLDSPSVTLTDLVCF